MPVLRGWTDEDLEILRVLYPTTPAAKIAKRLGRTPRATFIKAGRIGLAKYAGRQRKDTKPKPLSEWRPTYLELHDKAVELHNQRIPLEIRSRYVNPKANDDEQEFAIFGIYPGDLEKYWEEHGEAELCN